MPVTDVYPAARVVSASGAPRRSIESNRFVSFFPLSLSLSLSCTHRVIFDVLPSSPLTLTFLVEENEEKEKKKEREENEKEKKRKRDYNVCTVRGSCDYGFGLCRGRKWDEVIREVKSADSIHF